MDNHTRTWLIGSALIFLLGYAVLAFERTTPLLILSFVLIFAGVITGLIGLIRAIRA